MIDKPTDAKLVDELQKVRSDLRFRSWTRHRLALIVVFVALDILASAISITALVKVNSNGLASIRREKITRALNEHQRCETTNVGRTAQRKLWADLVARSVPELPPNATPAEKAARATAIKQGDDIVAYVNKNFQSRPC